MALSNALIHTIASLRRHTVPPPAVDTYRFPPPTTFGGYDPERAMAVIEFVAAQPDAVDAAARLWADDRSRDWMRLLYAFMALGPNHVALPTNRPEYWAQYEQAATLRRGTSERRLGDFPLDRFGLTYQGEPIELHCRVGHVAFTFLRQQYVFDRDGVRIAPQPGDVVIDAGTCAGDNALAFAAVIGPHGRVFSFDPMSAHVDLCEANLALNPHLKERIELTHAAVDEASGRVLAFADMGAASRPANGGAERATTVAIDDFVAARGLDRVDFIKMDIEGGEAAALLGAAATIRRFRPTLAISGYHKPEDLLVLPALIRQIEPSYRLYLEHYTVHQEETVIFATTRESIAA